MTDSEELAWPEAVTVVEPVSVEDHVSRVEREPVSELMTDSDTVTESHNDARVDGLLLFDSVVDTEKVTRVVLDTDAVEC